MGPCFFKEFLWEFSGQFSKHPDVKILWEMTVMQDITMTLGPWCFSSRKVYVESPNVDMVTFNLCVEYASIPSYLGSLSLSSHGTSTTCFVKEHLPTQCGWYGSILMQVDLQWWKWGHVPHASHFCLGLYTTSKILAMILRWIFTFFAIETPSRCFPHFNLTVYPFIFSLNLSILLHFYLDF